jgi:hypothetical protein
VSYHRFVLGLMQRGLVVTPKSEPS